MSEPLVTLEVRFNRFPEIARAIPEGAARCTNRAMGRTFEVSTPLTPIDHGLLRNNVVFRYARPDDPTGEIHWAQEYAGFQEYGTSRGVKPKKFVKRGLQQGVNLWIQELEALMEGLTR